MAVRKAEVIFVGDAASIVRAAKQAEIATAQTAAAAKKSGEEIAAANSKQEASHRKTAASISGVGSALSKMTLPILGVAAAGAKMSIDFQASMERIHTQAGASQKAVEELSKSVLGMAGNVAQSPQALADGMYHVVSSLDATLPAAKRVSTEYNVLKIAAEGATVGHANLVDVTNALDAAVVSGVKGVSNFSQAMGALNSVVGAGDMTMQDLADALSTGILGPMKTFGLSLTDVGGALATFGDNNIRGQEAATKLISAVRIMAAPSKAAAKELGGIGLSTLQLANDMRTGGIVKALQDLKDHLQASGDTASQQGLIISRAFGGRQSTGVQLLLGQLDRLKDKTKEVGTGAKGFGDAWAATQQTAAFKTQAALDKMKADLTRFGSAVLPPLLKVGTEITNDVDKVARAFSSLPSGAQQAIIKGGLILAGIGPALKILGVFTGGVQKLWDVARLISGGKVLGAAGGGGAVANAATTASTASSGVGLVRGLASRAVGGLALGGLGVLISQTVGSAVHGAVGQAIKDVGTDTAIGAGLGSIFGPLGTAGGALLGGLVGSFQFFIGHQAERQGKQWADKFLAPLPKALEDKFAKPLAAATTKAIQAQNQSTADKAAAKVEPKSAAAGRATQDFNNLFNAQFIQGQEAGKAFVAGFGAVKIKTIPTFIADATLQLDKLKGTAKLEGASAMVTYAQSLEKNGQLPKGATDNIIAALEVKYRNLAPFLAAQGRTSSATIAATLKWDGAVKNLETAEAKVRARFGLWRVDPNVNGHNVVRTFDAEMSALEGIAHNTTGKAHTAAVNEIKHLRTDARIVLGHMVDDFTAKQGEMADVLAKGKGSHQWKKATAQSLTNFSNFASGVGQLIAGGATSMDKGADAIYQAVVSMMKSFGGKPPGPVKLGTASVTSSVLAGASAAVGAVSGFLGHAGGGLVQFGRAGDKGRDNIPVNFGGRAIAVGSGEQGAVFNHTQQRNFAKVYPGGLPGFFSNPVPDHYMASGGLIPGFAGGGNVWEVRASQESSSSGGGWTELSPDGNAAARLGIPHSFSNNPGHYPDFASLGRMYSHGTMLKIRGPQGSGTWPLTDVGDGSSFAPAIGLTPAVSGVTGGAGGTVQITMADGSDIHPFPGMGRLIAGAGGFAAATGPGGVGAAIKQIHAPKVIGNSTIAAAVRAGLGKIAAAANKYTAANAPKPSIAGGFSGSVSSGFGGHSGYVFPFPKGVSFSWQRIDQGQDLEASPGSPIVAIAPGIVSQASDRFGGFGPFYPTEQITGGPLTGRGVYYGHTKIARTGPVSAGDVIGVTQSAADSWTAAPAGWLELGFLPYGSMSAGNAIAPILHAIASGKYASGGFVGSFKNGGIIPRDGMAQVHAGETVIPAAGGYLSGIDRHLLFPLDALLATLQGRQTALQNGPQNKKTTALLAKIDLRVTGITQLKALRDAIGAIKTQVKDLAAQAAQAWRTIQEGKINTAHDAAIKAIAGGSDSTLLAAMQKQDAATQNAATLAGLTKTLTDAQTLVAHSGGQTHLDALQQVKDAQAAIDAFNRQVTEQQLQDNITAATQKADDAQTVALAGLDQQTADYQKSLDTQFNFLDAALEKRKITYAVWAKDVNKILAQYGLSVSTDASTEATITAGSGVPLGFHPRGLGQGRPPTRFPGPLHRKKHRASGGPVQPGYVYRVGEEGPEDVAFGQRGTVMTASQTRRRSGGATVNIEKAYFTGTQAARSFADRLAFRAAIGTA